MASRADFLNTLQNAGYNPTKLTPDTSDPTLTLEALEFYKKLATNIYGLKHGNKDFISITFGETDVVLDFGPLYWAINHIEYTEQGMSNMLSSVQRAFTCYDTTC